MNGDSTIFSRKAAKLAKKNNEITLLKNLSVFAPLRETFSVLSEPEADLSGLGIHQFGPDLEIACYMVKVIGWTKEINYD